LLRSLRLLLAILALTVIGAGSARAASPIEGVWSFGGGKIAIAAEPSGTFTGTVTSKAKFSSCTHQVGEKVWTAIASQADGSYWGRHQWFRGDSCTPISTLGLSAWRVLQNASGSTYLTFCTSASGPSGPTASASPSFSFTSTAAGTFECRLDSADPGAWSACASPASYGPLAQGPHSFEVRAKSTLGDVDPSPASSAFSVDTEAPETTIDSGPTGPIAFAAANFSFSSSEEGSFECRIDSADAADWAPCDSPQAYESLADGPHKFEVRASDELGNTDPTPAVADFSVDTKAPAARLVSVPEARISSVSGVATFAFDSTEPGSFECRLDSAPTWTACTSPASYSSLPAGPHTFEVRAKDALGNTGPAASVAFSVDVPINGARVAIAPISGKVRIQTPDIDKFRPLLAGETIPVGSIVDTSQGKARLTSIDASGEEQSAAFSEGIFGVGQKPGKTLLTLRLRGGDLSECSRAGSSATASGAKGRRLWGSGKGNFRTEGSYGSATVRGTIWLTEDRCDGTFVKVRRGVVAVRDFIKGKTFSVPAGTSYLAQPGG
jgi:hypothetical protein